MAHLSHVAERERGEAVLNSLKCILPQGATFICSTFKENGGFEKFFFFVIIVESQEAEKGSRCYQYFVWKLGTLDSSIYGQSPTSAAAFNSHVSRFILQFIYNLYFPSDYWSEQLCQY